MKRSIKSSLIFGLALSALLSLLPVKQMSAAEMTVEAPTFTQKIFTLTNGKIALGILGAVLFINIHTYYARRRAENRFDANKLFNGTLQERAAQIKYFFLDKVLGWPYKADKGYKMVRNEKGEIEKAIKIKQYPGGMVGTIEDYLFSGSDAFKYVDKLTAMAVGIAIGTNAWSRTLSGEEVEALKTFAATYAAKK